MSEGPASTRPRHRGRAPRSTGPTLAPLPRLTNRWPPLEILTAEQVERILVAAFRILEEAGLEIRSPAARHCCTRTRTASTEVSVSIAPASVKSSVPAPDIRRI